MNFRLPARARPFFKPIDQRPRWLIFDSWYVCMLLGLRARKLGSADELEPEYFFDAYPEEFKPQADFIAGLLIDAELYRNNIDVGDKVSVEHEMVLLLDPQRSTGLSELGVDLLNKYAVAGFAIIDEAMIPPASIEDFLVRYSAMWAEDEAVR